jgi:nitrite reductase/ring-hydroxylating ferredoxin subunit
MNPSEAAQVARAAARLGEGDCARIEHDDRSLILVRHRGAVYCYLNRCPHRGTELDWRPGAFLSPDRQWLQCATHGALFDIDSGLCVAGPCAGDRLEGIELAPGTTAGP